MLKHSTFVKIYIKNSKNVNPNKNRFEYKSIKTTPMLIKIIPKP